MEFTTHLELHSQTTRLFDSTLHGIGHPIARDSHPLWRPVPRNIDKGQLQSTIFKLQLGHRRYQISNLSFCRFTRRYWGNPCWFLFLRLLICLSSAGSPTWFEVKLCERTAELLATACLTELTSWQNLIHYLGKIGGHRSRYAYFKLTLQRVPLNTSHHIKWDAEKEMTLKQACLLEYQKAQCAFKDSMIHENLQFILRIAFRCVLHRCENQEIRCWKFWIFLFLVKFHD